MPLKPKTQKLPAWFKVLLVTVSLASVWLLATAVVGRDGLLELQEQQERYQRLRAEVLEGQQRLQQLEAEAAGESGLRQQEKVAREDLDMVREGEIVYRLHVEDELPPAREDAVGVE